MHNTLSKASWTCWTFNLKVPLSKYNSDVQFQNGPIRVDQSEWSKSRLIIAHLLYSEKFYTVEITQNFHNFASIRCKSIDLCANHPWQKIAPKSDMSQLLTTPLEWLQRLQNNFKDIQNYFQNEALRASQQKKMGKLSTPKPPSSTRKPKATPQVPASVKVRNY